MTAGVVVLAFSFWVTSLTPNSLHSVLQVYPGFGKLDDRFYLFHRLVSREDSKESVEIAIDCEFSLKSF